MAVALGLHSTGRDSWAPGTSEPWLQGGTAASNAGKIAVCPSDVSWNKIRINFFGQTRFCEQTEDRPPGQSDWDRNG